MAFGTLRCGIPGYQTAWVKLPPFYALPFFLSYKNRNMDVLAGFYVHPFMIVWECWFKTHNETIMDFPEYEKSVLFGTDCWIPVPHCGDTMMTLKVILFFIPENFPFLSLIVSILSASFQLNSNVKNSPFSIVR